MLECYFTGHARCMARGCTHFMPLNCDEFYTSDQLQQAKRKVCARPSLPQQSPFCQMRSETKTQMVAEDLDGILCKTRVYFKSPSCELVLIPLIPERCILCQPVRWQLPQDDRTHVPLMYKVAEWMPFKVRGGSHLLPRDQFAAHHGRSLCLTSATKT